MGNSDPKRKTILTTNATRKGIGASLAQVVGCKKRIVAFDSRTLKNAELNYSITEREAVACYCAIFYLKFFLWGLLFVLRTDHKPLKYLFTTKGERDLPLELASGLWGWRDIISKLNLHPETEISLQIVYPDYPVNGRKGKRPSWKILI